MATKYADLRKRMKSQEEELRRVRVFFVQVVTVALLSFGMRERAARSAQHRSRTRGFTQLHDIR